MNYYANEHQNRIQRERRKFLKAQFEEMNLPRKLVLNGFMFSLHDIKKENLVFVCSRRTKMDCNIRLFVSWDQLAKSPCKIVDNIKQSLEIGGRLHFNMKGSHSHACCLQKQFENSYSQNFMRKIQGQHSPGNLHPKRELPKEVDAIYEDCSHFGLDTEHSLTLDHKYTFFHKKITMNWEKNHPTELFILGSEQLILLLRNCHHIFIDFTTLKFKGNTQLFLTTILAGGAENRCIPTVYLLSNSRHVSVFKTGFQEIRELFEGYPPKWKKCYSYKDPVLVEQFSNQFKVPFQFNPFEFRNEVEKEVKRFELTHPEAQEVIISMCESLWQMEPTQRGVYIDSVLNNLDGTSDGQAFSEIFKKIRILLNRQRTKDKQIYEENHFVCSNEYCQKYHSLLKEKFLRKKMNIDSVVIELRKIELETRKLVDMNHYTFGKKHKSSFRRIVSQDMITLMD